LLLTSAHQSLVINCFTVFIDFWVGFAYLHSVGYGCDLDHTQHMSGARVGLVFGVLLGVTLKKKIV
jgi:hypothetical protein